MKTATQVLEDQIADELSRQLAEEIDFEVLCSLLVQTGWIQVKLEDVLQPSKQTAGMVNWLHEECSGHWRHRGKTFVFENKEDAALFRLTWV